MKVLCQTNLDLTSEKWPSELPALPNVGDLIESSTKHGHFRLALQVVRITWKCGLVGYYPEIELHMTYWMQSLPSTRGQQGSITAFYEWYAPLVGRSVSAFI